MKIEIFDDFDLEKIIDSGQCFRPRKICDEWFQFITGKNILHIRRKTKKTFEIDCTEKIWNNVWKNYFDLDTNYSTVRERIELFSENKIYKNFLRDAVNYGRGIRILKQEPFETLISFIVSQRKNISSIRVSIEKFCERFGKSVKTNFGATQFFPSIEDISHITLDDLSGLGLAYRKRYIKDAIEKIFTGEVNLKKNETFSDELLSNELKKIYGVGDKISNCVSLFAYHRLDRVPIDVWINRAIEIDFNNEDIFKEFGKNAGILQQYVFYFKRFKHKKNSAG